MRFIVPAIVLTFCFVTASGAGTAAPVRRLDAAPMPTMLFYGPHSQLPLWVEASVALDEAGRLNVDLFGDDAKSLQQELEKADIEDCAPFERVDIMYADPPARGSLADALTHSRTRLLAEVTNKAFGIFGGILPGQLLQVVPLRTYGEPLPMKNYYFFLPIGDFLLGDRRVCKADTSYAEPPEIGSEGFLFLTGPPQGREENLLFVYGPGDIVPVARDGTLLLPQQFERAAEATTRSDTPRSKSELLGRLGQLFRQQV